ncbi:MAG: hypothetical protein HYZ48_00180 [Chlamydiales bacterium]|nr:hypothetical protein [Chlamydiales bacterium]
MNTLRRLEKCLLPPPEIALWSRGELILKKCTTVQKVIHCIKNALTFLVLLVLSPFTLIYDCFPKKRIKPITPDIPPAPPVWPPLSRGFACSLFQTSGFGTRQSAPLLEGRADWDLWMENPEHVLHPEGFRYEDFFTDVLSDPTPYLELLHIMVPHAR